MKLFTIGSVIFLSFAFISNADEMLIKNGAVVAFVGDSITQFGNRPDGFVHLVMDGLKRGGITAKALPEGIGGNKSDDILKRLPGILRKKPDWIVLQCGTNDVGHGERGVKLDDYKINIAAILEAAEAAAVHVMLVTPSMHTENPDSANNLKLDGYCDFIRTQAAERGLPLADWNLVQHETIRRQSSIKGLKVTIDNLHLNGYGNRALAETLLAAFGMEKEKIAILSKGWADIPSMAPVLNAWNNPQYKISINDYEILYRAAAKEGKSVEELVKKIVAEFIATEKDKAADE